MTFTVSELQAAAGPEPPEPAETLSPHHQQTQTSQVCLLLGTNETGSVLFSVNLKGSSELREDRLQPRGRIRAGPLRDDPAVVVTAAQN